MVATPLQETLANENLEETYDTSEPTQVNKARKRAARTRADRLQFVEAAMTTEQGRAWFYDILIRCKVMSTPYTDNPYDTAFKCGMQNIGLQILDDVQTAAPDDYMKMVRENKTRNG